jgi:Zn-dependent peptidase ImmA (M78 family)
VNDLRDAARQAAGRAFAAEFLAPIVEVMSMREDGKDLEAIADDFGVSTEVILRQLENARRIEQACAA